MTHYRCAWGSTCTTAHSDHDHATSYCHAQDCPAPPPCLLNDVKHLARFYHSVPTIPSSPSPSPSPNYQSPQHHQYHPSPSMGGDGARSPSSSSPWDSTPASVYQQSTSLYTPPRGPSPSTSSSSSGGGSGNDAKVLPICQYFESCRLIQVI
jgi:hypothetical protein